MGINGMVTETALDLYDSLDGAYQVYESFSSSDQPNPGASAQPPPRPFKRAAKDVRIRRSTCTTFVRRVTGHCRTLQDLLYNQIYTTSPAAQALLSRLIVCSPKGK